MLAVPVRSSKSCVGVVLDFENVADRQQLPLRCL